MKKVVLLALTSLISLSSSAEVVFKCYQPFSVYDPSFQQGEELYLDVEIDQNGVNLDFGRAYGPSLKPVAGMTTDMFGFDEGTNTFGARWGERYLSMVYLGNYNWGAFVKIDSNEYELPEEVELMCREALDVLEFASKLN